jgi:hypothetical protein
VFQFLKVDRSTLSAKAKVGLRIARDQESKPKLDEHKSGHPHHSGYRARYRAS